MNRFKASVIISTYNQTEWLKKVLWSYEIQTESRFEIIIADDGSTEETKMLINSFKSNSSLNIKHVWHEDNGFQKTKILNKSIIKASSHYIIFTDGDCIARKDFVETHLKLQKEHYFLSGGYYKLIDSISKNITKEDIVQQKCFNIDWLIKRGQLRNFKANKLTAFGFKSWLLNTFTTTKATFDGMNVSGWKKNIIEVNGFDERMHYGGEDREIGERLMNNRIKFKQIRYSAICLHLYHERPYKDEQVLLKNRNIRKETKQSKLVYTNFGIKNNKI